MPEFSKKDNAEFVAEFGKSWKNIEDKIFLWILFCSLFFTFILILFAANQDYENLKKNLSEQITKKYLQTLFSEIKVTPTNNSIDSKNFYSNINTRIPTEKRNKISKTGNSSGRSNAGETEGLDVNLPEALVAVKNISNIESNVRPIRQSKNNEIDLEDANPFDPWATHIKRQGEISIEPIEKIVRGSQIIRGWRNPNEITLAIQKKETMVEHCFKRESKYYSDMRGYIQVRFIILHNGIVDPASVKILRSTIHNKQVESCIKNRLRLWRGFQKLDESMGSVAVVQKFIFD